jgi:hypothetical protein
MDQYRVTLLVEGKDADEVGRFVASLGAPMHLQWDQPLHSETLAIELLPETLQRATIDAIREHIQQRREDPEFQARLKEIAEEDAYIDARLADNAKSDLGDPRLYFLLLHGAAGELVVHANSDPHPIARLACEQLGGEEGGPASVDDVAVSLVHRDSDVSYSIEDLSTFAIGFHSAEVPSVRMEGWPKPATTSIRPKGASGGLNQVVMAESLWSRYTISPHMENGKPGLAVQAIGTLK